MSPPRAPAGLTGKLCGLRLARLTGLTKACLRPSYEAGSG
jgi:hypothetical protein